MKTTCRKKLTPEKLHAWHQRELTRHLGFRQIVHPRHCERSEAISSFPRHCEGAKRPKQSQNRIHHFLYILLFLYIILCPIKPAYPFAYQDLDLTVRASISEQYDDNITSAHQDTTKDFITELSFGLGLQYEGKTRNLNLAANVNQQFFADNHDFNNTSEDVTLNFQQEFSKYDRISVRDVFSHTDEPRSFEEAFGRTTGRYSYYRNRLNIAYTRDIAKQLSLSAKYANEIDDISREDLIDSYLNRAGLEATYYFSSANILLLSYEFSNRDFDPGTDASIHTIGTGLRYYLTKQLYLDGQVGVDLIESFNDEDFSKPLIQVSLTNDIDESSRASISFAKRYYTSAYSQDLFDYWWTSGRFTKQIFRRLELSLSGFYGEGEYIGIAVTDKLRGASISLTYDLKENMKANFSYSYSAVDSTVETREYSKNSLILGITIEF